MGLALARIQLIGEQAILKRGSPGAPRLTALGLDREAARRARQRVSAEIVALPVSCSSGSDPEAETSAVTAFGQNQQLALAAPVSASMSLPAGSVETAALRQEQAPAPASVSWLRVVQQTHRVLAHDGIPAIELTILAVKVARAFAQEEQQ